MTTYEASRVAVELAAIIRGYRARFGLTQAELAAVAGVDQSHWSAQERAKRPITMDQLAAVCQLMNITPAEVMDEAWRQVFDSV